MTFLDLVPSVAPQTAFVTAMLAGEGAVLAFASVLEARLITKTTSIVEQLVPRHGFIQFFLCIECTHKVLEHRAQMSSACSWTADISESLIRRDRSHAQCPKEF